MNEPFGALFLWYSGHMKKTTLSLILSALALCISLIALWRTLPAKQQTAQPVEEQPAADPALVGSWATNDAEMMIGDDGVVLIEYKKYTYVEVFNEETGRNELVDVPRIYVGHLDGRQLVMERSVADCTMNDYLQNPDAERAWYQEYYVVPIEVPAKDTCRIDYRHIGAPFTFFRQ